MKYQISTPSVLKIAVCFLLFNPNNSQANDWGSCAMELDSLRMASSYASDAANNAESAKSVFENANEELQNCINFPSMYDIYGDNCENLRRDYESAKDDYESALSDLESELGSVELKVKSLEWACKYEKARSVPTKKNQKEK